MISVVIITKNEEKNLRKCLDSVLWCDELIVIDDFSQDKTVEIARKAGARIFNRELNSNFSSQRNFGLSKAKCEWVLFIDADEIVSNELKNEILEIIKRNKNVDGYFVKRNDFIFGSKVQHGEFGNIKLLRLGRVSKGKWEGRVHEEWRIKGEIDELKHSLLHYPHQSINEFIKEINFYTDIRAKELFDKGTKSNFISIILYTKLKFVQNYFLKLDFLDGTDGLILALIMSFHSFLVRSKLWLLWQKK